MQSAAEAVVRDLPAPAPAARPIRALPAGEIAPDPTEQIIRRLAADRLRELADDGVTLAYVARMYDVPADQLEWLRDELLPSPR
ncbi:MAG TPA: hypothetical protein VEX86_16170 [Longimicrobium sp.]|nr:hypothetical protein [Longimicrobium sp.]